MIHPEVRRILDAVFGYYEQQEQIIQKLLAEAGGSASGAMAATILSERRGTVMTINKTDEEWRRELTPEQYRILREKGTERAFTGEYHGSHKKGMYTCAACGLELFDSDAKFDSGTGWPSFYQPVAEANVNEETDVSHGMGARKCCAVVVTVT